MKFKKSILLTFISFILIVLANSCGQKQNKNTSISGEFLFSKGETVFLDRISVFNTESIDSAVIDNNMFEFKIKKNNPEFYKLRIDNENQIILLVEPGEKVKIKGDIRNLPSTYKVEGSEGSVLIHRLNYFTLENYRILDSLAQIWEQRKYDIDGIVLKDSLDSIAKMIYAKQEDFVRNFILENKNNLASILALYQVFGRVPLFDEIENLELYRTISQSLNSHFPNNPHVLELLARVNKNTKLKAEKDSINRRLQPGNPIPEISLPNQNGEPISINNFLGKTVLVYFWMSHSQESRAQIQELIKLHRQFATKNFQLFNVSFDMNEELWKNTINFEKLPGINLIDTREWSSPLIKVFNIKSVPHNILVDKEGKIIGTNLTVTEIREILNTTL